MNTPYNATDRGLLNSPDDYEPDHDPSFADYADCENVRDDGEPCAKTANHAPPCVFLGEWRY